MRTSKALRLSLLPLALGGVLGACEQPPWAMPCPEGWVMREDQTCYDPAAADDDSAGDDDAAE